MDHVGHLRTGDGDAILHLIAEAYEDEPGPGLPWVLLDGLAALLGRDTLASYQVLAPLRRQSVFQQGVIGPTRECCPDVEQDDPDDPFFDLWWDDPMRNDSQRTGDLHSIRLASDFFPTLREARNRPLPVQDSWFPAVMCMPLPAPPGLVRFIAFARDEWPGFDERDRQVATLLRPHVQEIWLDAERRRGGVPDLTPREWEVLALVDAGLSHHEIASRLFIATSTVHKHMEHIRERLGVSSAAAAVAVALPHSTTALRGRYRDRGAGSRTPDQSRRERAAAHQPADLQARP